MTNDLKFCDIEKLSTCFMLDEFLIKKIPGDKGQEIFKSKKPGDVINLKITYANGKTEHRSIA